MACEVKLFDGVLLASNFDRTLVPQSGTTMPGVKRAIQFFIENGGRFTICTGRIYHAMFCMASLAFVPMKKTPSPM